MQGQLNLCGCQLGGGERKESNQQKIWIERRCQGDAVVPDGTHGRRVSACIVGNMQSEVMDAAEFRIPHSQNMGSLVGIRYNSTWRNGCTKLC